MNNETLDLDIKCNQCGHPNLYKLPLQYLVYKDIGQPSKFKHPPNFICTKCNKSNIFNIDNIIVDNNKP